MNQDIYNRLSYYYDVLHASFYCNSIPGTADIQTIDKIFREYSPKTPPVDMGCSSCVIGRLKDVFRHLLLHAR